MKNKTVVLTALMIALALPAFAGEEVKALRAAQKIERQAHSEQQKQENQTFRQRLKAVPKDQRVTSITEHRNQQFTENQAFRADQQQKRADALSRGLAANTRLTAEEKAKIIANRQTQTQENQAFREQKHQENIAKFQQVATDPNLTHGQKKDEMKVFRDAQKVVTQAHFEQQRTENKALHDGIKAAHPKTATP